MADDIEVTFIDAATDKPFERVNVPATRLPDTFAHSTTLRLGDLEWSVESANPTTRAEYERTKKLALHLRKVEVVDPEKILFSLPTIENAIPLSDGDPTTGDELVLHEDDWRQLELISGAHEEAIDEELDAIGEILLNHRAGAGFTKIHVRSRTPNPLVPNAVRLDDLGKVGARALTFRGTGRRVRNSFVVDLGSNASFYGTAEGGDVRVLCLRVEGALEDDALETLERLQKDQGLIFVDWCSCRTGMRAFFQE